VTERERDIRETYQIFNSGVLHPIVHYYTVSLLVLITSAYLVLVPTCFNEVAVTLHQ
jgi:hypothetical protein